MKNRKEVRPIPLTIDLSQKGLALVLKDYQEVAMNLLWKTDVGQSSRDVWVHVNEVLKKNGGGRKDISRASIINFLNMMVDEGVLAFHEITGKGGHRRIYSADMTEEAFWSWLIRTTDEKLKEAAGLYHV